MAANFLRFVFQKIGSTYILVYYGTGERIGTQGGLILITRPYNDVGITLHLQKKMKLLEIIILKVTSLPTETKIDINYKEMIEK